ncbi:MAG: AMP-binding protein [Pseudomonadota bacterium]
MRRTKQRKFEHIEETLIYLASIAVGGVFLPLNSDYTDKEVAYFLGDAGPRLFICDDTRMASLAAVAKDCGVDCVHSLHKDGLQGSWIDCCNHCDDDFTPVARAPDDLAALLYTSGTTGRAKGAMLTHNSLASNAQTLCAYWHFTRDDVLIHALPIFHTHGLFVAINTLMCASAAMILLPKFDADSILSVMEEATVMMGVPTFYTRLLAHKGLTPQRAQSMRLFISGSAPLLTDIHHAWHARTGHAILERYGMTETNMIASNPYAGERRAGFVGHPLPGVEVRIEDDEGGVLPTNEIGMITVRGPNVFVGYWQMPEKTKTELRDDGWFITGDNGYYDEKGYLAIIGRQKDLIISGGYNVYPKEVEDSINQIAGITESAVIGVPHSDFGEGVVAIIVQDGVESLSSRDIMEALRSQLAKYKLPKHYIFLEKLPRNTMGKVQKAYLRDTYQDLFQAE